MNHDADSEPTTGALRLLRRVLLSAQAASTVEDILRAALEGVRESTGWPLGHAYVPAEGAEEAVSTRVWSGSSPEVLASYRGKFALPALAGERVVAVLEFFAPEEITVSRGLREALDLVSREIGHAVQRQWTTQALRESEGRFRLVAQSANDAIVSADEHGRITFWNRCAEGMFGHAAADVMGAPLTVIIPEKYRDAHTRGMARLRDGGEAKVIGRTVSLEGLRNDGTVFPVELSLARWSSHDAVFYSGIIRDVSERRAAELRLAASEGHAREVSIELQRKNQELESRRAVLDADLREASAFQRAMIPAPPEELLRAMGLRFHARYEPAELVGGDLYDLTVLPSGALRVFVADTVGHGVQAALRTMVVKTLYERHKTLAPTPAEVLARMNVDVIALQPDRQMRLSACSFDLVAGAGGALRVRFANAAQLPLVILRGAEVIELYEPGAFLGVSHAAAYHDRERELLPGDRLLAYTDGLIEQWSPAGVKAHEPALLASLARFSSLSEAMDSVMRDLDAHRDGEALPDDLTFLGFEILSRFRDSQDAR